MRISAANDASLIDAIAGADVARFTPDWLAVAGRPPSAAEPIGIAVSGGTDSVALLLLARAAFPGAVLAATVDHGLRAESAEEAAFVGTLCTRIGVPHAILPPRPEMLAGGNLQDRARAMRYRCLGDWAVAAGAPWVAVAHQQDDLAETFLLRARRGAGLGGLAAMRPNRPLRTGAPTLLVRPLLGWSRAELAALIHAAGIEPVEDPSNRHPRFDRSRARRLLAETPELPPSRLALAATNLRDAEAALDWVAEREWAERAEVDDDKVALDLADLPRELRRRLVARALKTVADAPPPRGSGLDRLIAAVDAGRVATLAGVVVRPGPRWQFAPAPPHRSP
ncbi:tRNA(Ile)-lysidine synthase [Sphingomonas sp. NFR04]|uniref:tRNA lysidine(34) synthetase TilS n=1 Tax=Sphingomonas sp. NFR04 TaxID=1566283 RepID=UPI0008E7B295|nr:tRNA lysidine(34) synthetase TilS [Sphingomonas sp. NFR04]SFJ90104.1 tRNA(Ile)-lysidine synthase [Sphingomonas sp. NFR04]